VFILHGTQIPTGRMVTDFAAYDDVQDSLIKNENIYARNISDFLTIILGDYVQKPMADEIGNAMILH
jgi:hypothetical protein